MIRIHKEGNNFIKISLFIVLALALVSVITNNWILKLATVLAAVEFLFLANFFRNPLRQILDKDDGLIYAPADGKVVVIEEIEQVGFPENRAVQLSIFMSPMNVHVNRYPTGGIIQSTHYYPGKYLVAWHPKSSTENERHETSITTPYGPMIIKQIAGAVARRIVCYAQPGTTVEQGSELGFIKFGSRVDLILPTHANISVAIGQKVKGNQTVLGKWN